MGEGAAGRAQLALQQLCAARAFTGTAPATGGCGVLVFEVQHAITDGAAGGMSGGGGGACVVGVCQYIARRRREVKRYATVLVLVLVLLLLGGVNAGRGVVARGRERGALSCPAQPISSKPRRQLCVRLRVRRLRSR
jgi:hypothetical protein